jgi:uncharacterized protein
MLNLSHEDILKWQKHFKEDWKIEYTYEETVEAAFNWVGFWDLMLQCDMKQNPDLYKKPKNLFIPLNSFEIENEELINQIVSNFKIDFNSIHGISHWRRVREIGNFLAKKTEADLEIVNLFAYLHDSKRQNENDDLKHGKRAIPFINKLNKRGFIKLDSYQLKELLFACEFHADSFVRSDSITIQTCWDADRLDLGRVGVIPQKQFLNTSIAKNDRVIRAFSKKTIVS